MVVAARRWMCAEDHLCGLAAAFLHISILLVQPYPAPKNDKRETGRAVFELKKKKKNDKGARCHFGVGSLAFQYTLR